MAGEGQVLSLPDMMALAIVNLKDVPIIHHGLDDGHHVVRLCVCLGNVHIQLWRCAGGGVKGGNLRGRILMRAGKKTDEVTQPCQRIKLIVLQSKQIMTSQKRWELRSMQRTSTDEKASRAMRRQVILPSWC